MVAKAFAEIEEDIARGTRDNAPTSHLRMTLHARRAPSIYHTMWAKAEMEEEYTRGLWRDNLKLAFSYDPGYAWAWFYRIFARLPGVARLSVFERIHRLENAFGFGTVAWLDFGPMLKSFVNQMTRSRVKRSASRPRA
jgi:hypothetical protein